MRKQSRLMIVLAWVVLFVGLFFVWDTTPFFPFRMLAVFFHEISHGAMAIATGGSVHELALDPREGGHALTSGGSRFLTLSAGYLGNVVFGGLLMVLASRMKNDRILSIAIGVLLLFVTLYAVRGSFFAFGFGVATAAAFLLLGWKAPHSVNDAVLKFTGGFSCLYAIFDIKDDVIGRSHEMSDGRMLADLTHIPTAVWGWTWIAIAFVTFVAAIWASSDPNHRDPLKSS